MGRELARIEAGEAGAVLDDQVDGLGGEGTFGDGVPAIDRPEYWAVGDVGAFEPVLEGLDRAAEQEDAAVVVGLTGFGAAEHD